MESSDAWHQTERLHAEAGKGDPFAAAIRATRVPMIVTDPSQPDNPIVFSNDAFLNLTGYSREECLGRNCRFLQGPDTDRAAVQRVREAVGQNRDISIDLLNYRKDGTPFWAALCVSPVIDERGATRFFFASQLDVSERKDAEHGVRTAKEYFERVFQERSRDLDATLSDLRETNARLEQALETKTALLHEVDHRVKNNLQMVSALILLQSRTIEHEGTRRSLLEMLNRIEALGTVHRRLYQADDATRFEVAEFLRDLVHDLVGIEARDRIVVVYALSTVEIAAEQAAPVALIVNEVVTNALKHAFPDGRKGTLLVGLHLIDDRMLIEICDDGVGQGVTGMSKASFGTSLVRILGRQLKATVTWADNHPGTKVTIDVPKARLAS